MSWINSHVLPNGTEEDQEMYQMFAETKTYTGNNCSRIYDAQCSYDKKVQCYRDTISEVDIPKILFGRKFF